jgi:hypothetical protein
MYCISHSPARAGLHPFAVAAVILMPLKRAWALCDAPPQHHSRVPKHHLLYGAHFRTHSQRACKGGGGRWGRQGQVGGWRMVVNVHTSTTASVRETHAQKVADHFAAPTTSTVAPTNPLDTHSLRRTHTPPRSMVGVRTAHSRTGEMRSAPSTPAALRGAVREGRRDSLKRTTPRHRLVGVVGGEGGSRQWRTSAELTPNIGGSDTPLHRSTHRISTIAAASLDGGG